MKRKVEATVERASFPQSDRKRLGDYNRESLHFTFTEMNSISVSASLPLIAIGFLFASGRQSSLD